MGLTKKNPELRYKNFKEKNKKKESFYSKDNKKNIFNDDSPINEELRQILDDTENKEEKLNEKKHLEIFDKIENKKKNKNFLDELYNNKAIKSKKSNKKNENEQIEKKDKAVNIEIQIERNESSLKFCYMGNEEENQEKIEGVILQINVNSGKVKILKLLKFKN